MTYHTHHHRTPFILMESAITVITDRKATDPKRRYMVKAAVVDFEKHFTRIFGYDCDGIPVRAFRGDSTRTTTPKEKVKYKVEPLHILKVMLPAIIADSKRIKSKPKPQPQPQP